MPLESLTSDFLGYENRLSEKEKDLLSELRAYLEATVKPIVNDYWDRGEFPHHVIQGLADLKILGLAYEETRPFENSAVFRGWVAYELARIDASIATFVGVQNGLVMGSIDVGGSRQQRTQWLPKLASGEIIGAFGLTEPLSGSDAARGLRTTATREGDTWILNGAKRWIGNATHSDITIIWAKDTADNRVLGFIVPNETDGFTTSKIRGKTSLRIVQNADIVLQDVRIPETLRLQNVASFKDTAKVLRLTRADVAWEAVGLAAGSYEAAREYSVRRVQFGKPIAGHQLVQNLLVKSLGNITASIGMVTRVSEMLDAGEQKDEHSALAKTFATERMRESVAWCRELFGGNGIILEYDVARFFADAEALYSYEGTREMNTLIVGRAVTGVAAFA